MDAISSAVIGGTLLSGGVGTTDRYFVWCLIKGYDFQFDYSLGVLYQAGG